MYFSQLFGQINLSSAEDWVTTWFRLLSSDNKLNTSCVFFSLIWSCIFLTYLVK